MERPRHYPGKVRQASRQRLETEKEDLQTCVGSVGTEEPCMGKAVLTWLRKDSAEGAESEATDKHINTQGSAGGSQHRKAP